MRPCISISGIPGHLYHLPALLSCIEGVSIHYLICGWHLVTNRLDTEKVLDLTKPRVLTSKPRLSPPGHLYHFPALYPMCQILNQSSISDSIDISWPVASLDTEKVLWDLTIKRVLISIFKHLNSSSPSSFTSPSYFSTHHQTVSDVWLTLRDPGVARNERLFLAGWTIKINLAFYF